MINIIKKSILIFAIILTISACSQNDDHSWVYLTTGTTAYGDSYGLYVNKNSIKIKENFREAEVKASYHRQSGAEEYREDHVYQVYDCNNRKIAPKEVITYINSSLIKREKATNLEFEHVKRGTTGYDHYKFVCDHMTVWKKLEFFNFFLIEGFSWT